MLKIGALAIAPPLLLAPMAGVTDQDFRLIVRRIGGVGVVTMEFVSSKGLVQGERRWQRLLPFSDEERPISIQIYGSDGGTMAAAAEIVAALSPDLCDVNMGCPANKVLQGCAGAALMGDLGLARSIIVRVRRALSIPLTVKFRLGLDETRKNYLELGHVCEGEGVDAVALHARTARQMYTGRADWSHIARLKDGLGIPVIGNGDVETAEDALRMLRETGCDGVMVGRGATRNPWIFREIAAKLAGAEVTAPTLEDRRRLMLDHFRAVVEREDASQALHKLRTFTGKYSQGLPGGQRLRRSIQHLPDAESFFVAVGTFFDELAAEAA